MKYSTLIEDNNTEMIQNCPHRSGKSGQKYRWKKQKDTYKITIKSTFKYTMFTWIQVNYCSNEN